YKVRLAVSSFVVSRRIVSASRRFAHYGGGQQSEVIGLSLSDSDDFSYFFESHISVAMHKNYPLRSGFEDFP
ncbi:MAG: hypothetical protein M3Z23_16460, partial [Acidobacteriota bacterium]|nr:hypothetical protein [Acidobacteriota bacterium]